MLCLPADDESRSYITSDNVDSHSALEPSVSTDDLPSQLQDEEPDEVLNVEEPSIVRGKDRSKGSVNKRQKNFDNSIRREPSFFEIDQGSLSQPSHSTSQ
ncbi:hypothetical protein K3495_g7472 [Podosphaera aphanis]|nr:hypothetical protein K3495_g7472 [Podosphaera aphanis]